jgi:hypothetical protein
MAMRGVTRRTQSEKQVIGVREVLLEELKDAYSAVEQALRCVQKSADVGYCAGTPRRYPATHQSDADANRTGQILTQELKLPVTLPTPTAQPAFSPCGPHGTFSVMSGHASFQLDSGRRPKADREGKQQGGRQSSGALGIINSS